MRAGAKSENPACAGDGGVSVLNRCGRQNCISFKSLLTRVARYVLRSVNDPIDALGDGVAGAEMGNRHSVQKVEIRSHRHTAKSRMIVSHAVPAMRLKIRTGSAT